MLITFMSLRALSPLILSLSKNLYLLSLEETCTGSILPCSAPKILYKKYIKSQGVVVIGVLES